MVKEQSPKDLVQILLFLSVSYAHKHTPSGVRGGGISVKDHRSFHLDYLISLSRKNSILSHTRVGI